MADEKDRKDAELEGSKEGEALDKILEHMGNINDSVKKLSERMDAIEGKKADSEEEEEEREDKHRKDAKKDAEDEEHEESEDGKKDAKKDAKKDEEGTEALKKEREENDLKENDGKKDAKKDEEEEREDSRRADSVLRRELDDIKRRLPVELSEEDRAKFVDAQVKADSVAQKFGKNAPRAQNGETLMGYRKRLLREFQPHSSAWKNADLTKINDSATLATIEAQVYADAASAALNPAFDGEPGLREIKEMDRAGRNISKFYGSAEACWAPFKTPVRALSGIKTKFE